MTSRFFRLPVRVAAALALTASVALAQAPQSNPRSFSQATSEALPKLKPLQDAKNWDGMIALLDSIPKLGVKEPLFGIPGQPPDLSELPGGCAFHPRCPRAVERCREAAPSPQTLNGAGHVSCWLPIEEARGRG